MQDTATRYAPYVLSIVRIVAALLFFEHGTSRLFGWPSLLPTPALLSMYWFAGAIELVGGALLEFASFGSHNEWAVLDPSGGTLRGRPVGWQLSGYQPRGPVEGWDEFLGYYQNRTEVHD